MTAAEFEAQIARTTGVTVEWLHLGMRPVREPCDCGEPCCEGWQMGHQHEDAILENQLRDMGSYIWW